MSDNEESLGITILKGIGKLLVSAAQRAADPDTHAKLLDMMDKQANKSMRSGNEKASAAAAKYMENSGKYREAVAKAQERKRMREQQEQK
jgi:hypothetical protein